MPDTIVSLSGVNKVFNPGTPNETTALHDINLDIAPGEFVSIIGPSGCGKSTLLRLVGDLIQPSTGTVTVMGKPAEQARLNQDYGIVFQQPVLFEWRTISANVQLPLEMRGVARAERQQKASELLRLVELSEFERHYPWQLSGGMQQRAAIARALAADTRLLLMDEPFGALDEFTRERMNDELHRLWQLEDTTVIFVTHSIAEAVFLSTKIVVMSARPGQIMTVIDVDLPTPRNDETRESPAYFEIATAVRETLRQAH